MADISQITLPTGTTYDLKDAHARALINQMSGYTDFLGVTTTALTDGATTNPITVNGSSVTAKKGNIVTYGSAEFIFNGSAWQEFGDLSGLGALAFKDTASASYTPDGTVSQPTFSGTQGTISVSGTVANSVTLDVAATSGTGYTDLTPAGTVTQPSFTGTSKYIKANTTTVNSITAVGTLPSCTLPTFSTSVSGEVLTLGWSAGSFSAGTLPTKGSNTTVATGIASATSTDSGALNITPAGTVSQPTFTGTGKYIKPTVGTASKTMTGTYTPAGTVSQPTFSGTAATITSS